MPSFSRLDYPGYFLSRFLHEKLLPTNKNTLLPPLHIATRNMVCRGITWWVNGRVNPWGHIIAMTSNKPPAAPSFSDEVGQLQKKNVSVTQHTWWLGLTLQCNQQAMCDENELQWEWPWLLCKMWRNKDGTIEPLPLFVSGHRFFNFVWTRLDMFFNGSGFCLASVLAAIAVWWQTCVVNMIAKHAAQEHHLDMPCHLLSKGLSKHKARCAHEWQACKVRPTLSLWTVFWGVE